MNKYLKALKSRILKIKKLYYPTIDELKKYHPAGHIPNKRLLKELTVQNINETIKNLSILSSSKRELIIEDVESLNSNIDEIKKFSNIFNKFNSDKSSSHNYEYLYSYIFNNINYPFNLLEIGLGTNNRNIPSNMGKGGSPGASLYSFKYLFPESRIIGADIDRGILVNDDKVESYYLDQNNLEEYFELLKSLNLSGFDIVIDDGLHSQSTNLNAILFSLEKLNVNGFLVIEDIVSWSIETWQIVNNLIPESFETKFLKTSAPSGKFGYAFLLKRLT